MTPDADLTTITDRVETSELLFSNRMARCRDLITDLRKIGQKQKIGRHLGLLVTTAVAGARQMSFCLIS